MNNCIPFIFTLIHPPLVFCLICMPSLPRSLFTHPHTLVLPSHSQVSLSRHGTLTLIFTPDVSVAFPENGDILLYNPKTVISTKRRSVNNIIPSPQINTNSIIPSTLQSLCNFPQMSQEVLLQPFNNLESNTLHSTALSFESLLIQNSSPAFLRFHD